MKEQAERLLREAAEHREIASRRNAVSDLFLSANRTGVVRLWMAVLTFLRRFRMLRLILRTVQWLFMLLEAGTLIVLTTAIFFVLLPLLAAGIAALLPIALADRRQSRKRLSAALADSRGAVFLFAPGAVAYQTAVTLAAGHGYTVLLVSPYRISPRRTDGAPGQFFLNLRREADGVFLIRRSFYFCARKLADEGRTAVIY